MWHKQEPRIDSKSDGELSHLCNFKMHQFLVLQTNRNRICWYYLLNYLYLYLSVYVLDPSIFVLIFFYCCISVFIVLKLCIIYRKFQGICLSFFPSPEFCSVSPKVFKCVMLLDVCHFFNKYFIRCMFQRSPFNSVIFSIFNMEPFKQLLLGPSVLCFPEVFILCSIVMSLLFICFFEIPSYLLSIFQK